MSVFYLKKLQIAPMPIGAQAPFINIKSDIKKEERNLPQNF